MSRRIQTPDGAASGGGDPGLTVVKGTRSRPDQTVRAAFQTFKQQQLGDYTRPYGLASSSINLFILYKFFTIPEAGALSFLKLRTIIPCWVGPGCIKN